MGEPGARLAGAITGRPDPALPALIPYFTAGFPHLGDTPRLLAAAQAAGCAAAEVGIPFSDPLADGPTIQRSGWRALSNGVTPAVALRQIADARAAGVTIPLAVMTYVNPVLSFGGERFAAACSDSGVDAMIVPDLPSAEATDLREQCNAAGIGLVAMVAPTTTPDRLDVACSLSQGFIYCVSVTGVTGERDTVPAPAIALLDAVGRRTKLPRCLGFGLSRHDHLLALVGHAEGAIVGSALLSAIGDAADPAGVAEEFLRSMRGAPVA